MPNLFRKQRLKGTGIRSPRGNMNPPAGVPTGFTKTKSLSKRDVAFSLNRMGLSDAGGNLRICIQRKLGGVGDVLMSTAAVHAIRDQYPNSEITYATTPALFKVVENNPDIDVIVDFTTIDPGAYDYFADITSVCPPYEAKHKPPINRIDLFAKYIGIGLRSKVPVYVPTVDEVEWAKKRLFNTWGPRDNYKLIFLSVASFDSRRTWPIEKTIQLISQVTAVRPDVRIIIDDYTGKGAPWGQLNTMSERFSFRPMAALLNECDLFVGPDSGPLHLAGALQKSIVSIFGPTDPASRINHYDAAIAITAQLGCQHCWYQRCDYELACMTRLEVSSVEEAVLGKLNNKLPADLGRVVVNSSDSAMDSLSNGLRESLKHLGCDVVSNQQIAADDLVIDVFRTSTPPKSSLNLLGGKSRAAYVIVDSEIPKSLVLRLAKYYDFILTDNNSSAQILRSASPVKPVSVILPPLAKVSSPDRGSYFVHQGVDNLALLQAVTNGQVVVLDLDAASPVPDMYLLRTDNLTSFAGISPDEDELANAQLGAEWLSDNAWISSTHRILNMFYQRVTNA